jgi:hypothetical protein
MSVLDCRRISATVTLIMSRVMIACHGGGCGELEAAADDAGMKDGGEVAVAGSRSIPSAKNLGDACSHSNECRSGYCPLGIGYCTRMCTDASACPSFWRCDSSINTEQSFCRR